MKNNQLATLAPASQSDVLLGSSSMLPPFQNLSAQVLADSRIEDMQTQMQMLRHEKREADDLAYREAQNAKRLSTELVTMRDQIQAMAEKLKRQEFSFEDLGLSRDQIKDLNNKVRDLRQENEKLRIDLAAKDREMARRDTMHNDKMGAAEAVESQIQSMQNTMADLDSANVKYKAEIESLKRDLENMQHVQKDLEKERKAKDEEKELRITAELDL